MKSSTPNVSTMPTKLFSTLMRVLITWARFPIATYRQMSSKAKSCTQTRNKVRQKMLISTEFKTRSGPAPISNTTINNIITAEKNWQPCIKSRDLTIPWHRNLKKCGRKTCSITSDKAKWATLSLKKRSLRIWLREKLNVRARKRSNVMSLPRWAFKLSSAVWLIPVFQETTKSLLTSQSRAVKMFVRSAIWRKSSWIWIVR